MKAAPLAYSSSRAAGGAGGRLSAAYDRVRPAASGPAGVDPGSSRCSRRRAAAPETTARRPRRRGIAEPTHRAEATPSYAGQNLSPDRGRPEDGAADGRRRIAAVLRDREAGADQRAVPLHRGPRLGPGEAGPLLLGHQRQHDLPADLAEHDHSLSDSEPERQRPGAGSARAADRRRLQVENRRAGRRNVARRRSRRLTSR